MATTTQARGANVPQENAWHRGMHYTSDTISHNPASAVMLMFGVGFAVGVCLGTMMSSSRQQPRSAVEQFGRQALDTISRTMPEALSRHLK